MIYTGLGRLGEIADVKAHGGADVAEVYGGINEENPIYYKTRTITGQAPLSYKALSKPLSDYLISGNTVQNGTPTPSDPIYPEECGERTVNLAPAISIANGWRVGYLSNQGVYISDNPRGEILSPIIPMAGLTAITISATSYSSPSLSIYYFNGNTYITKQSATDYDGSTFNDFPINATHFCFAIRTGYYTIESVAENGWHVMVNSGSTALPYELYGYKLPLTVNGVEYPIYFGQVPTTRRIRKLVLDGVDNKFITKAFAGSFATRLADGKFHEIASMCSHFMYSSISSVNPGHYFIPQSATTNQWNFWWDDTKTLTEANQWLADQYAAGTPVTVWYVLAVPETGIVNEPLHKIGDYADTISMTQAGVTIPTVAGTNTLTVGTTVQPSEISITGNIKEVQGT